MAINKRQILHNSILKGFNINPYDISKISKEKSSYIIHANNSIFKITKMHEKQSKIEFIHNTKEEIDKKGFKNIDKFILSSQKKPYFYFDANNYTMTNYSDFSNYKTLDFSNEDALAKSLKSIGDLHKYSKNISINSKPEIFLVNKLLNLYKKGYEEFNLMKKRLKSNKHLSDFDIIFINNYKYYKDKIEYSILILESISKNKSYPSFACHNLLKEENILFNNDKIFIINFNEVSINHFIFDIAYFINRYIKSMPNDPVLINDIIHFYSYGNDINEEDLKILTSVLNFPIKYLKICKEYYSKKRTWVPGIMNIKLHEIIQRQSIHENYIELL